MSRQRVPGDGPKCDCGAPAVWSGFCHMEDGRGYCPKSAKCLVCGSNEAPQVYALTVDGVPLSLQPTLCYKHGSAFVFRAGMLIAELADQRNAARLVTAAEFAALFRGETRSLRPPPRFCSSCGNEARAPRRDELGEWTWNCVGGCNP